MVNPPRFREMAPLWIALGLGLALIAAALGLSHHDVEQAYAGMPLPPVPPAGDLLRDLAGGRAVLP